ncbi:glycosyl hydrolase 53 family protein [Croceibacterium sp. TMG7-5b_MA50]|uniref:glycosyl hydrolase 53 family protein n=1 Tax=Croceibacterium sp. TMG7-5b_MA50 TaxID=3121290 RepID=UPI003222138E
MAADPDVPPAVTDLSRRQFSTGAAVGGAAMLTACATVPQRAGGGGGRPWPYLLGADITWVPEDEAIGATYWQGGVQRDPLAIFADAGFNAIKLRTFVNPENGYSRGKPGGPWGSIDSTIAFARRIKAAGLHLSTTLHYSDTWADPQKQTKPAAWADLPLAGLVDAVHDHTADALGRMEAAGVAPDLVVLGNETTFGMLWPEGRIPLPFATGNPVTDREHMDSAPPGGLDRFAALLKAGIAASRSVLPDTPVALHNHLGRHWQIIRHWTDSLIERDVRFDALGMSCYQQQAQGDWERTFDEFSRRYPDHGFFAIEYSSRKRYVNDLVHAHPNGWGSFIWEPTRHQEAIFLQGGVTAGEGPKPDLLSQGLNSAEAPGATPSTEPPAEHRVNPGGRFDADPGFIDLYRQMARDYGVSGVPIRR